MLQHVFSVYGGQSTVATDLLVYHEKNAPLEAGYCIHNGGKFKLLIKTVGPGYPTQLPGSGSTGPMTSGPGYKELNSHIERAIDTSSFDDVIVTSQLYLWRLLVFGDC